MIQMVFSPKYGHERKKKKHFGFGAISTVSADMEQVGYFKSPLGIYEINADEVGVKSIHLEASSSVLIAAENNTHLESANPSTRHIEDCIKWLDAYFSGASFKNAKVPALNTQEFENKPFFCKVWEILKDQVKCGQTVTYGELAKMAGSPGGARAVGMAMKTNPISLIVPCHRVIKSGGALGNYSSYNGVASKRWLLEHESALKQQ